MPHRDELTTTVTQALRDRCGVGPGDRILLALSGGADSVALLRALAAIAGRREWKLDLHAIHVNHQLRPEAGQDAAFAADLCGKLQVMCHHRAIDPRLAGGNLEAAGRKLRHAAFEEVADEIDADWIATAHHADDQLETLLMRIIRGSSLRGMRGIVWRRGRLIRPMLRVDRAAITGYLHDLGQTWREDATNGDLKQWRARLRHQVLPVLRELRLDAAMKATDTAERLAEAAAALERAERRLEQRLVRYEGQHRAEMDRTLAVELPADSIGGLLRRVALRFGADSDGMGLHIITPMIKAITDGQGQLRCFDLAGGVRVRISADRVEWNKSPD